MLFATHQIIILCALFALASMGIFRGHILALTQGAARTEREEDFISNRERLRARVRTYAAKMNDEGRMQIELSANDENAVSELQRCDEQAQ